MYKIANVPSRAVLVECYVRKAESVRALSEKFGVSPGTIRRWLDSQGIPRRGISDQLRMDYQMSRRAPPVYTEETREKLRQCRRIANFQRTAEEWERVGKAIRKKQPWIASAYARQAKTTRPCGWCGNLITRHTSQAMKGDHFFCSHSHCGLFVTHRRYRSEEARPLVLDRLRESLRGEPWRSLPRTLETLEKAGEAIGAGDAEYVEVILEWRNT